ncbi:MAG: aminotransferase class V-fold PLP-dependent enzyme [Bacteroidales bacterium]|nr:aminotransferase class V-fold PLP-dependent enzyme [Bacteroidales bacterium]MBN2756023.1 aminotransferase class V-fold PLP-dependent enzyme [Bacteroidales bacterium]
MNRIFLDNINSSININESDIYRSCNELNSDFIDYFGRKSKAKIDEIRNYYSKILKTENNKIFFAKNSLSSFKSIINYSLLFLDIQQIITSEFENNNVLDYLKSVENARKIKLIFIETDNLGKISTADLEQKISKNNNSLVFLLHANEYNGILLPVKEVSQICIKNKSIFYLNLDLTICKYDIDFQTINPDFASFDFKNLSRNTNSGIIFYNQQINISNKKYIEIRNNFIADENINPEILVKDVEIFNRALRNMEKNKIYIVNLKKYLISKMKENFNIENTLSLYNNEGLYFMVSYFLPTSIFGKYILQKLDIEGITVGNADYPNNNKIADNEFIRIGINEFNTEKDINFFISKLINLKNNFIEQQKN